MDTANYRWIAVCLTCEWVQQFEDVGQNVHPEHDYVWVPKPQRPAKP